MCLRELAQPRHAGPCSADIRGVHYKTITASTHDWHSRWPRSSPARNRLVAGPTLSFTIMSRRIVWSVARCSIHGRYCAAAGGPTLRAGGGSAGLCHWSAGRSAAHRMQPQKLHLVLQLRWPQTSALAHLLARLVLHSTLMNCNAQCPSETHLGYSNVQIGTSGGKRCVEGARARTLSEQRRDYHRRWASVAG